VPPVGSGAHRPALGLILPATLQGELPAQNGATPGATQGAAARLAELCRRIEATGADSLWAVDHLFWPHPINECLTTLAIAAGATEQVTLGSCILQLPLRQPSAVAKQVTSLQHLADGRFVLGLGVGSHADEYDRAGVDFHQRGRLMDAGIEVMRQAWASADDPAPDYRQLPAASRVPLWIGGASAAARRRAAAVGDGWIPLFVPLDEYGPAVTALRRETEAAGRPAEAVTPAVVVFAHVGADGTSEQQARADGCQWLSELYGLPAKAFHRHLVAGPAEACAATLHRFAAAGARHIVVMVAGAGALEHFGRLQTAFVTTPSPVPVGVS
jgi:alkanesulfonate monooxygenase SsuD/methylene tetrahydromethanopterin reductase-like flavin-dependent oxidoreductase (luciferase family)